MHLFGMGVNGRMSEARETPQAIPSVASGRREGRQSDLVVVGSSAGGVEALSILVSTLPDDFPAPIVLAQHLDPARPSSLDIILRRRTTLPVELVTEISPLEPGKIYVVPSNRQVLILDGHVEVKEDSSKRLRARPSVDTLLSTAAEAYGDHLIAVILTGSGSDGAAGAVDVKNAGGTVVIQDPQTARYPSMPLALPPTVIDFEAVIEQIGPLLYDLLLGVNPPRSEEKTEDVLQAILEQVGRQASIDFRPYKTSTILRRIGRRMTVTHNSSMREYEAYLRLHPEEVGELVKSFLINVTQFFRDADAFAYLKSDILPNLIQQARSRDHVLRLWAAGCASGEEPYSLAMLLTDLLSTELPAWSVKIFATDLDEAAINFARRGLYSENLLKEVPGEYRDRFFERVDHGYRISKTLRQMVIFGQQDLARSAPFPRVDLVLCRNVLIYFTPELQEYVLNQFAFSLSPGGYLFLGKAETVRPTQLHYELVNKQWKVYRYTGSSLVTGRRQSYGELAAPRLEGRPIMRPGRISGKPNMDQEAPPPTLELGQLRRINELLLRFLPVGVVVINRSYHVLTANGTARRLLGLREMGGNEQDFLHAVRGIPYVTVRQAIDAVFRERNSVNISEIELDISVGGNGHFVNFSIALMQMEAGTADLVVISVSDVTDQVQLRRQLETVQSEQARLMNELGTSNKHLNDVNKELLDANEELQVSNEELVLTHEELQATIEEFETTNEELQATNEELETNNEELQATNEELATTNEELRARTAELQELTTLLDSERVQLSEMVELAPFDILVLRGPALIVEASNSRYMRQLGERKVQGRPLADIYELLWADGMLLVRLAHEVFTHHTMRTTSRMRVQRPEPNGTLEERYFFYTLVPSHDALGRVTGVIIYAIDETEQYVKDTEAERTRLRLIFENASPVAMAMYDAQTEELLLGSSRFLDLVASFHHLDRQTLLGRTWRELSIVRSIEQVEHAWETVQQTHTAIRLPEVPYATTEDGQKTVWDWNFVPIVEKEQSEKLHYILISATEVTEQARVRQEMEQVSLLKDDFLSLASHELRTPLTAVRGYIQLLQHRVGRQSQAEHTHVELETLNKVEHQIDRLNTLIGQMLDITRMRGSLFVLQRQHVELVALVRRVAGQLAEGEGRAITIEARAETIVGNWDEERLEQVLLNLLSNAIKYSPAEKPIVVTIEQRNAEVITSIRDTGRGISEQDQAHIFDRFYRVHWEGERAQQGLGLGLFISREIINQHGGRLWLESEPGKGSTFYFSLPI